MPTSRKRTVVRIQGDALGKGPAGPSGVPAGGRPSAASPDQGSDRVRRAHMAPQDPPCLISPNEVNEIIAVIGPGDAYPNAHKYSPLMAIEAPSLTGTPGGVTGNDPRRGYWKRF
jgi:hypothetical protein